MKCGIQIMHIWWRKVCSQNSQATFPFFFALFYTYRMPFFIARIDTLAV